MSITIIQLKQVLRNRRFLLFTILFPGIWYLFMIKIFTPLVHGNNNYQLGLLMLALLMGILGNSIVTFSKRIAASKRFYFLQSHITHYSIWRFLFSQLITQVIVNLLITAILILLALLLHSITFTLANITSILLVNFVGIYFSIIGFTIGIIFDSESVDASGTPLMFILALFIIPWKEFLPANNISNALTTIQKCFPSYYIYECITNHISENIILFFISFTITVLPFLILIYLKLKK